MTKEASIPMLLQEAVVSSLQIQAKTTAHLDNAASSDGKPNALKSCDCMSVLGLMSPTHVGKLAIAFPAPTLINILEKMIGERFLEITDENADACSELLNIIYASARVKINQAGFEFQPAIPTTIRGEKLSLALSQSEKSLDIKFKSDCGDFSVILHLKRTGK